MKEGPEALVIAVSSRALFALEEANEVFESRGVRAYRDYQKERLDQPLHPGVAFPFVRRLLGFNEPGAIPSVEVVVLSRNSPETGERIFRSCRHHQLAISRGAFLSGGAPHNYMKAYGAALFLSAHRAGVETAVAAGFPAGWVLQGGPADDAADAELRVAFDFDGVLADDEAERVYAATGSLEEFASHEAAHAGRPHGAGPLHGLFTGLGRLQRKLQGHGPGRLSVAIVTARGAPAEERVITTLKSWGMSATQLFLMGGSDKLRVLQAFRPHIFFDDQLRHLSGAAPFMPSVLVPFGVRNVGQ